MGVAMKSLSLSVCVLMTVAGSSALARSPEAKGGSPSPINTYSQKTLLKNWALATCMAEVARDERDQDDARATASAYLEFGKQPIEAYEALRDLVQRYARLEYGGSIPSRFNTMKCIDLFHSKELDRLAGSLSQRK